MVTPERLAEFYEAERQGQPVDRAAFAAAREEFGRQLPGDPVTHLCDHLLGEGLAGGWRQMRLGPPDAFGAIPVRANLDDAWRPVMLLPAQTFRPLVDRFLAMAHRERSEESSDFHGELEVTVKAATHRLPLSLLGAPGEAKELLITFPASG